MRLSSTSTADYMIKGRIMITGLELVALSKLEPILVKTASSASAKAAGLAFVDVRDRFRSRVVRKRALDYKNSANSLELTPELARNLELYLISPEFESIAISLAIQHLGRVSARKQDRGIGTTRSELRASLSLALGTDPDNIDSLADTLHQSLTQNILSATNEINSAQRLTTESRAAMLRLAGSAAAASARNVAALKGLSELAEYAKFEMRLRDQIKNAHATMKLPHAGTNRKVPYSKLFVSPRLAPSSFTAKHDVSDVSVAYGGPVDQILSGSLRTVILGDPGGGKSTLAQKLTHDIAKGSFSGSRARLPLLVVLRDYTDDFKSEKLTMVQHLEGLCRFPYNVDPPDGAVEYLLANGHIFVIFDGLDELVDTSLRRRVVEFVEAFANLYPTTPMLITTRRVGYEEAPLDPFVFKSANLSELTSTQVEDYANKWFSLDTSVDKGRRQELAESFLRDSEFVSDLRLNPLMLSLMCGIYASEHYIPTNRPDVYKKCAELLFERWDKQRGIVTPLPFDAHVKHALNSLAFWMYSDNRNQQGLTYEKLVTFMTEFLLQKRFDDEGEAENAATQFVKFCTGRAWVLTDIGSNQQEGLYGFTHRTFLEYFAANQLVRLNPSAPELFRRLRDKLKMAEWEVVAQLAVQILGNNVEDGADKFLDLVVSAADKERTHAKKCNLLAFAARSLEFVVPRPQLIEVICNRAILVASQRMKNDGELPPSHRPIGALFFSSEENSHFVAKYLREELKRAFKTVESGATVNVEILLCIAIFPDQLAFADGGHSRMTSRAIDFWLNFSVENRSYLSDILKEYANSYGWLALAMACSGDLKISEVIHMFGPQVLYSYVIAGYGTRPPFTFRMLDVLEIRRKRKIYDGAARDAFLRQCLSDMPEDLMAFSTPWFNNADDTAEVSLVRHVHNNIELSGVVKVLRDSFLLISLPYAELDITDRYSDTERGKRVTWRALMSDLHKARAGAEDPAILMAKLRAYGISSRVIDYVSRWIRCELSLTA